MDDALEEGVEGCSVEDFFQVGFKGDDFGGGELVVGDWVLESGLTVTCACPRGDIAVVVVVVECRLSLCPPFFNRRFRHGSRRISLFC